MTPQSLTNPSQREAPTQSGNAKRQPEAAPRATSPTQRETLTPANTKRRSLLHRYIFWTDERGSFHYDVMVTLILLFLFVAPHFIDFHDRPLPEIPARTNEFLLRDAGQFGTIRRFVFEVRAEDIHDAHSDADIRAQISRRIAQFAPDAQVDQITPVKDPRGQTVGYDAIVLREHPNTHE